MKKDWTLIKANILPFGASKCGKDLVISVPMTEQIDEICLISKTDGSILGSANIDDVYRNGDIYSFKVKGAANCNYVLKHGGVEVPNPYARVLCGNGNFGNGEGYVYGAYRDNFKWDDIKPSHKYEDSFIYRLHVRGFTKHKSSKVRNKGTFAGIVEKIDYLKELGVTAVELMPAYEFDENIKIGRFEESVIDKRPETGGKINYWGYGKAHYFAPKESFSSKKKGGQVNEFKYMVNELHKAGIEVIMDFYFVPDTNPCLIADCLRHWVIEYHIDGIHVNMEVAPAHMIKEDPVLSTVKIFADSWETMDRFSTKGFDISNRKKLAISNDDFMINIRRFIKSDEGQVGAICDNIRRNPVNCGIINYVANHNSFTLMDTVSYERKHNEDNGENNSDGTAYNYSWNCGVEGETRRKKIRDIRKKQIKNALTLLFISQGTPMLYAGDEMGRSQKGNNNPYCQDNEISWINWNLLNANKEIYEYVKQLMKFRKRHKVLHMEMEPRNLDYLSTGAPDLSFHGTLPWKMDASYGSREIGILYNGAYGENEKSIYVMANMYWDNVDFNIPQVKQNTKWKVAFSTEKNYCKEEITINRKITIPQRCVVILEEE